MLDKGFQKPKYLEVDQATLTETYGRFLAQPYERGFGTTIGNSLRRILLSSIEGAAITAVKIEGVLHEFSSVSGVTEDITDVILNLKKIPIRLHIPKVESVRLNVKGARTVTAADIEVNSNVEILDPVPLVGIRLDVDLDDLPCAELLVEQPFRERVLDESLDRPAKWSRALSRVAE